MTACTCTATSPGAHDASCPEALVERVARSIYGPLVLAAHRVAVRRMLAALRAEPIDVRARAVGLAARVAELDVEHMVGTPWCPECGPGAQCDEEGLCVVCGATVGVVRAVLVDAERGDG